MRRILFGLLGLATVAVAGPAGADVPASSAPLLPYAVESFDPAPAAAPVSPPASFYQSASPARPKYLAVLASALIPGLGEMLLGYEKRGAALMAIDAGGWVGYALKRSDGLDSREAYEDFADQYWTVGKWINDHPDVYPTLSDFINTIAQMDSIGQVKSGSGAWPGYNPWVSKEEDKQHYYENVGKYDWYISGWDDWDPDVRARSSERRDEYRAMRRKSNDQLDTANQFLWINVGARVFSILQTAVLARRVDEPDLSSARDDKRLSYHVRPSGFDGGTVSLEYRFR